MDYQPDPAARTLLLARRDRLMSAISTPGTAPDLRRLLDEVDTALERHANGTYGLCSTCGDPIEAELIRSDPLVCFCLEGGGKSPGAPRSTPLASPFAPLRRREPLPRQSCSQLWE